MLITCANKLKNKELKHKTSNDWIEFRSLPLFAFNWIASFKKKIFSFISQLLSQNYFLLKHLHMCNFRFVCGNPIFLFKPINVHDIIVNIIIGNSCLCWYLHRNRRVVCYGAVYIYHLKFVRKKFKVCS